LAELLFVKGAAPAMDWASQLNTKINPITTPSDRE
jgi:hypothetical protein